MSGLFMNNDGDTRQNSAPGRTHGKSSPYTRTIAVTSGKGGVGKTSMVINLAVTLSRQGQRVLIMDCDLGLSNVDVLLGVQPRYNLTHALKGERELREIIVEGPEGISVLPAPFGNQEITNLSAEERLSLLARLEELEEEYDIILLDTGAGISSNVLFFNMAANHIVVVMTPEPTSVTDAYALIKVLNTRHSEETFHLLVNEVRNDAEGLSYYRKLTQVTQSFLNVSIRYLGCILKDVNIGRGTMACKPAVSLYPTSDVSKRFETLADRVRDLPRERPKGNIQFLLGKSLNAAEQTGRVNTR